MPVDEYVRRVVAGELTDPTLTFQLKQGFAVRGLLQHYLERQRIRQLGDPDPVGESRLPRDDGDAYASLALAFRLFYNSRL